jgi:anti-sigma factor RsiW
MTSCRDIAERADSLAEGGLDPALRRELEAHLAGCPQCQAFVAQLDLTSRALRALPPPELPASELSDDPPLRAEEPFQLHGRFLRDRNSNLHLGRQPLLKRQSH